MYIFLYAHLCLWYWRAGWEWAVCHLAAKAAALPRHGLRNRWTKRARMRKPSVHDICTHAFTKPACRYESFSLLTTAGHHNTAPYLHIDECVGKIECWGLWLIKNEDHCGNSDHFNWTYLIFCVWLHSPTITEVTGQVPRTLNKLVLARQWHDANREKADCWLLGLGFWWKSLSRINIQAFMR